MQRDIWALSDFSRLTGNYMINHLFFDAVMCIYFQLSGDRMTNDACKTAPRWFVPITTRAGIQKRRGHSYIKLLWYGRSEFTGDTSIKTKWVQLPTPSCLAFRWAWMDVTAFARGCVRVWASETMNSVFGLCSACSQPAWLTSCPARDSCSSAT